MIILIINQFTINPVTVILPHPCFDHERTEVRVGGVVPHRQTQGLHVPARCRGEHEREHRCDDSRRGAFDVIGQVFVYQGQ